MNTTIPYTCYVCGHMITKSLMWVGERPVHHTCMHNQPTLIPARDRYVPPSITEDRVREIVREEILKAFTK